MSGYDDISLYQLLSNGDYVQLFEPAYEFRASYAHDPSTRQLLRAGSVSSSRSSSDRLTSRKLEAGSRLVTCAWSDKRPDRQINYGTGNAVNEESIDDARVPLKIRWYSNSYLDIPVRHEAGRSRRAAESTSAAAHLCGGLIGREQAFNSQLVDRDIA